MEETGERWPVLISDGGAGTVRPGCEPTCLRDSLLS